MSAPIQFVFRPRKLTHPAPDASQAPAFAEMLAIWKEHVTGTVEEPGTDLEDWAENAVLLKHAIDHRDRLDIFLNSERKEQIHPMAGLCKAEAFDAKKPFLFGGPELNIGDFLGTKSAVLTPSGYEVASADKYMHNKGFWAHSNRAMEFAAYDDGEGGVEPDENMRNVLAKWRDEGKTDVFIKVNGSKRGVARIDTEGLTDPQIDNKLMEIFEWTLVEAAGRKDAFLLQEFSVMEHEYRVFVVDGKPVAGAGCIEEFTPLNNDGNAFDQQTRRHRIAEFCEKSAVTQSPDIVARYQAAAPAMAEAVCQGHPGLRTFVMDLCMINDEVSIVEVNRARNCGLYAMNYGVVFDAIVEATQKKLLTLDPSAPVEPEHTEVPTRLTRLPRP